MNSYLKNYFDNYKAPTNVKKFFNILRRGLPNDVNVANAVYTYATKLEPGVVFKKHLESDLYTDYALSYKDLDEKFTPYYGYIRKALKDLLKMGCYSEYTNMWEEYFLEDNTVYRVNVVMCLILAAAMLSKGEELSFGDPTRFAREFTVYIPPEDLERTQIKQAFYLPLELSVTI